MIQEINRRLLEVDHLNSQKLAMNEQLVRQIQFVRDLQAAVGKVENGNISEVVDKEMERDFRQVKTENLELKQQLQDH